MWKDNSDEVGELWTEALDPLGLCILNNGKTERSLEPFIEMVSIGKRLCHTTKELV